MLDLFRIKDFEYSEKNPDVGRKVKVINMDEPRLLKSNF